MNVPDSEWEAVNPDMGDSSSSSGEGAHLDSGGDDASSETLPTSILSYIYVLGIFCYFFCCGFGRVYSTVRRRSTACLTRCETCCTRCIPPQLQTTRPFTSNCWCSRVLMTVATNLIALGFAVACAPLWPALALYWFVRRVCPGFCRLLCTCPPCLLFIFLAGRVKRARLAARLRREDLIRRLRTCPTERKWRDRGWLVILRARHQSFLARQRPGYRPRVRLLVSRRNGRKVPRVVFRSMGDPLQTACSKGGVADVGVCEEGRSNREFARVVGSVVDIQEEGLFRGIVMYL